MCVQACISLCETGKKYNRTYCPVCAMHMVCPILFSIGQMKRKIRSRNL